MGVIYLPQSPLSVDTKTRVTINNAVNDAWDAIADEAEDTVEDVEDAIEDIIDDVFGDADANSGDMADDMDAEANSGDMADDDMGDDMDEMDANMDDDAEANTEVVVENNGYVEFDEASYEQSLADWKNVALFFHATWCPTCTALSADMSANYENIPSDTVVYQLDYDTSTELKEKYLVTKQHTIVVVDADGEMINSFQGAATLDEVIADIESTQS